MGGMLGYQDRSIGALEEVLTAYLNGPEAKSVLTPGEYVEWKVKLKAGQVVIAEASSDTFDPALQMVDSSGKVLAFNDDRYPGDQRPLLLWRCSKDGEYGLRVRSFRDKFGGQCTVRFNAYDCVDAGDGRKAEYATRNNRPFLIHLNMAAGEIEEFLTNPAPQGFQRYRVVAMIAPDGLPSPNFAQAISPASPNPLVFAPVAGDYYAYCGTLGLDDKIKVSMRRLEKKSLSSDTSARAGVSVGEAPTREPALWTLPVKAGQLLRISLSGLKTVCHLNVTEAPDISKYDIFKDDENPFFPKPQSDSDDQKPPLFTPLPGRDRDNRVMMLSVNRDGTMWIASNGDGPADAKFHITVAPGSTAFPAEAPVSGKLAIADTDYWSFDASPGDVLTLSATASGFTQEVALRNPELREIRQEEAALDQSAVDWRVVIDAPGRYLESIAARGNGGSGEYTLVRHVIHPKPFGADSPAEAEIGTGDVQVWRLSVTPDKPLLVHWSSAKWNFETAVYNEKGESLGGLFDLKDVDPQNKFGILKADRPTTLILVLSGRGAKAEYSLSVGPIPGYK